MSNNQSIFGKKPKQLEVNYVPHAGQHEVTQALKQNFSSGLAASIIEIIAGRSWGKTVYLVCGVLVPFLESHPNAKVMWVAPTYQTAMSPIDDVFKGTNEATGERYVPDSDNEGNKIWEFTTTKSGPIIKWYNGATVVFRSADSPDSIVSRGFNLIVMDEAALIAEQVFMQQILGTARKAGIKIFMISTPRGKKHWTYKFYLKGQDPKETNYLSFQQPYYKNSHFNKTLESLIKDIPDWVYRQEYLAEFIDDGDSVFKGLERVVSGDEISFDGNQQEWKKPIEDVLLEDIDGNRVLRKSYDRRFVVSMDIAKSVDYTVLMGMDVETGDVVYYKRMNKTDYREVLRIAANACAQLNHAELIFDSTGVGQGLADMLNNYNVISHPYHFTNESKTEIINKLAISIEHDEIKVPNIVTIKNELAVFTYTITRTGKISYNAPSGFHDDIVISLALANWYRKENLGSDEISIVEDYASVNGADPKNFYEFMQQDDD